jgi:chromate transporter
MTMPETAANRDTKPDTFQITRVFARIGVLSFGGPAAQIGLMHKELVEERAWLSDEDFLRALSLCMLLPGPEAMQLATYAGWRLRGTVGGLIAGLLFVLPGACVILVLALVYAHLGEVPLVQAAFEGIKAAVIVIVLQALRNVSGKALRTPLAWALAAGAFIALFFFDIPFPIIIAGAALTGAVLRTASQPIVAQRTKSRPAALPILLLWGGLWLAPILALALTDQAFLLDIALFFSKLAVVTFGGAYAVLAYMTQTVVAEYGWISTAEMIDALGLAETTPGPLILVTQFVAMLAGFAQGGTPMALAAGALALWVTFTPCFLWIFLAAPYLDDIAARPRLSAALASITAAVVGVILNLALWFAIHVLFENVVRPSWIAAPLPEIASAKLSTFVLTGVAAILLLYFRRGIAETLGILALASVCITLL